MPSIGTDYQNAKPMDDFTPIPVGDYEAVITNSEIKDNKKQTGQFLQVRVEIISGEHQGRVINRFLNLWHPNQQTVEIANRELTTIVNAVKKQGTSNSEDLHNIPMIITVGVEPGQPWVDANGTRHEGRPQNNITNYKEKPALGTAPTAPIQVQTKPAPQQAAQAGQPPINPATGAPYKPWENWPGK